jgi:hypothetical protein
MSESNPFNDEPVGEPAGEPVEEPADEPAEGPNNTAMNWFGLRNSEPDVKPDDVAGSLDLAASWTDHLLVGFLKQTGGEGTEAWMHYVISMILLADREHGLLSDEEREGLEDEQPNGDKWDDDKV